MYPDFLFVNSLRSKLKTFETSCNNFEAISVSGADRTDHAHHTSTKTQDHSLMLQEKAVTKDREDAAAPAVRKLFGSIVINVGISQLSKNPITLSVL